MKTIGIFADVSNLYYCTGKRFPGRKLNYAKLKEVALGEDVLYRAFAYGLQLKDEATKFITCLKHFGFEPKYKTPRTFIKNENLEVRRTSWNVGITLDISRILTNNKLDVVVICSADSELVELVEYIKERGVKCVVIACGISKELKEIADQWIEITEDFLEQEKQPD